jgi:hypothetical protein
VDAETTTRIRINVGPYEGEYEVFDTAFSTKEWRWIKQLSGGELRAGQFDSEAFADPDFILALAVIAMRRAGKITADQVLAVADELSELPFDGATISLILPEVEEEDEVPLALTSEPDESSGSDSLENEHSKPPSSKSSGSILRPASDLSDENPEPTGITRSDTSSTFDLTSLAT